MAIVARNSRIGGGFSALNRRLLRQRLMPLLLLAFFCEVTLPYHTTCPHNHMGVLAEPHEAGVAVPDDDGCGMDSPPAAPEQGDNSKDGGKKGAPDCCSLCALNAAFTGYVTAGLVSLPPPVLYAPATFSYTKSVAKVFSSQNGFSARAPPALS